MIWFGLICYGMVWWDLVWSFVVLDEPLVAVGCVLCDNGLARPVQQVRRVRTALHLSLHLRHLRPEATAAAQNLPRRVRDTGERCLPVREVAPILILGDQNHQMDSVEACTFGLEIQSFVILAYVRSG